MSSGSEINKDADAPIIAPYSKNLNLYTPGLYSAPSYITSVNADVVSELSTLPISQASAGVKITNSDGTFISDVSTDFKAISDELVVNRALAISLVNDAVVSRYNNDVSIVNDISTEAAARIESYNAIAAGLASEEAARNTHLASVSASRVVNISNINSAIEGQSATRASVDDNLTVSLNNFKLANSAGLALQKQFREESDAKISSDITSQFAVLNLSQDEVVATRIVDLSSIQSLLNAEVVSFEDTSFALQSTIDILVARMTTDENNIAQTITNYQAADTTIISSIMAVQGRLSILYYNYWQLKYKVDTALLFQQAMGKK